MMAISPDASKFAFRLNKDGHDMLVVRNKVDSSLVGAVKIDGINPNSLYFVNDNTVILVATQNIRLAGYWGRHDASWTYAYNIKDNKEFPLLTQGYGIYKGQTQLGRIVGISPDKKHVYMPAYQNEGRYSLYKVRLDKKRKPKRVLKAGAAFTPDLYKCAVSINGVSDIERMMKQEQKDYGKDHWVVSYWNRVIKDDGLEDNFLETISPINFVKQVKTPVILIHGARDEVVPMYQSEILVDEMENANKIVKFVELEKGNHHLSKAENRMKAIDAFLKEYLN